MGLAQIQRVLSQLYTDDVLRERFFADPQAVGEVLGLSSAETHQLAQLSAQHVNFFARSLKRNRLNVVCKLLPLTHRVLGKRFSGLFLQYADTHVPMGTKKHQEDAGAFSKFVEQAARVDGIEPPWIMELVRYEASCLGAADTTCWWIMRWFRYPPVKLVRSLMQGDGAPLPLAQPTIALWFRFSRRNRLRHIALTLPRPFIGKSEAYIGQQLRRHPWTVRITCHRDTEITGMK